jgi:hypothetical protein
MTITSASSALTLPTHTHTVSDTCRKRSIPVRTTHTAHTRTHRYVIAAPTVVRKHARATAQTHWHLRARCEYDCRRTQTTPTRTHLPRTAVDRDGVERRKAVVITARDAAVRGEHGRARMHAHSVRCAQHITRHQRITCGQCPCSQHPHRAPQRRLWAPSSTFSSSRRRRRGC